MFIYKFHSRRRISPHCSQRPSGLAQRRLTLPFMRATTFQFRTAFSAGVLPPLRQTACCAFGILPRVLSLSVLHYFVGLHSLLKSGYFSASLSGCTYFKLCCLFDKALGIFITLNLKVLLHSCIEFFLFRFHQSQICKKRSMRPIEKQQVGRFQTILYPLQLS